MFVFFRFIPRLLVFALLLAPLKGFADNSPPTSIRLYGERIVFENAPNGSTVGSFEAVDPDGFTDHTFTFVGPEGNAGGRFGIVDTWSLYLANTSLINYEVKTSHAIRVRATDGGGLFTEKAFTITVRDENEAPSNIALSNNSVAENSALGTVVGTFTTFDPDANQSFIYGFNGPESNAGGRFTIEDGVLKVFSDTLLNHEAKASHVIRVRSSDGLLAVEKVFTIFVNDVNEQCTNIGLGGDRAVIEGAANGSLVGALTTIDPDKNETFAYAFIAPESNAGGRFQVAGGALQIGNGQLIDYEVKTSHAVRLRSTDHGGLTVVKAFTIGVLNVENEAPTNIGLGGPRSVPENSPTGTLVGNLTTVHGGGGSTFTYSFVAPQGNAGGRFKIVGAQLQVDNGSLLDFETRTSHAIQIRSTDQNGLFTNKAFTIAVENIAEH